MKALTATICAILLSPLSVLAQTLKDQSPPPPKTKLEAFTGENGAVIIKGYTDTAKIRAIGNIDVSAMMLRNAKTSEERRGLSVSLKSAQSYSSEVTSYIDYDEINDLLAGIDYISQADTSITKLANFEATYRTKGDFKITVFNNSAGANAVNIMIGTYGSGAFFAMKDLSKLREAIVAAKDILDNPDSVAAKGDRAGRRQRRLPPPLLPPLRQPRLRPHRQHHSSQSRTESRKSPKRHPAR